MSYLELSKINHKIKWKTTRTENHFQKSVIQIVKIREEEYKKHAKEM